MASPPSAGGDMPPLPPWLVQATGDDVPVGVSKNLNKRNGKNSIENRPTLVFVLWVTV
ncbi:hypothetical protein CC78DRAFT_575233 [Lojkania enalia]|uniref:Uncharacterized protein n=1 Tax=Lojkania enalia TaxID=147567 RepID=A0A9P4N9K9_9PLEO|nr:hypothetical protein CC78DRAFT_575233 [Didymosphaeria enalia]